MNTYHKYPPQSAVEFEELCNVVRLLKPEHIMEIGSRHGRSLIRLAEAAMPYLKEVTTLDLPGALWGQPDSGEELEALAVHLRGRGVSVELQFIDSHGAVAKEMARRMHSPLARPVDFLFLDGDHTYRGIKQDYDRFSPLVRKGGVIAFHDIAARGGTSILYNNERYDVEVKRFWDEVKHTAEHYEEFIQPGANFGIGVMRV